MRMLKKRKHIYAKATLIHEQQVKVLLAIAQVKETMLVGVDFVKECHAQPKARLDYHQTLVPLHIQGKSLTQWYYAVNGVQKVNSIVIVAPLGQIDFEIIAGQAIELVI